jgi:hypothetical protein
MAAPLFEVGLVVATPGALALAKVGAFDPAELLERHQAGELGRPRRLRPPREREGAKEWGTHLQCLPDAVRRPGLDHHRGRRRWSAAFHVHTAPGGLLARG